MDAVGRQCGGSETIQYGEDTYAAHVESGCKLLFGCPESAMLPCVIL